MLPGHLRDFLYFSILVAAFTLFKLIDRKNACAPPVGLDTRGISSQLQPEGEPCFLLNTPPYCYSAPDGALEQTIVSSRGDRFENSRGNDVPRHETRKFPHLTPAMPMVRGRFWL